MLNIETQLVKGGLVKTLKIRELQYDIIEFTIHQKLTDENGKVITDTGHTSFFESREFKDFFEPFVNMMKERIENETNNSSESDARV